MSLITGLENGGMVYGMDYGIFKKPLKAFFHSNSQLYCVAIHLLTYS